MRSQHGLGCHAPSTRQFPSRPCSSSCYLTSVHEHLHKGLIADASLDGSLLSYYVAQSSCRHLLRPLQMQHAGNARCCSTGGLLHDRW